MPARSIVLNRLRIVFGICLIALVISFADGRAIYQHLTSLNPLWLIIAGLCICISSLLGAFNLFMLLLVRLGRRSCRFTGPGGH